MGNQDSIPDKFQELWKYILNRIRFQYHFIRNTGQIRDLKRDRTLRIDKRTEPVHDLSVYNFHCPYLNDLIPDGTKTGRLNVEHNIRVIQRLRSCMNRDLGQVIYYIAFHPVKYLKRIVLVQCLNIVVGIRECLCYPVIRDRNSRVSPVMSPLYDIFYF